MLACEESASIVCARVMRGTSSIASALTPARGERLDAARAGRAGGGRRARAPLGGSSGDLVVARRRHPQHDVGSGRAARGVCGELGARERVALVGEARRRPGAALDPHAGTGRDQALGLVGRERDPSLAVCALAADGDEHARRSGVLGLLGHARRVGLHVRIADAERRDRRLLDRARRRPAHEVVRPARLVVRAGRAAAAEGLLPDDRARGLVVDVEVARRVAELLVRERDRARGRRRRSSR